MTCTNSPGFGTAAYLYVLNLDAASLAWEYLRRNAAYRLAWNDAPTRTVASAARPWGLEDWEDPHTDARAANPLWLALRHKRVRVTRYGGPEPTSSFHFWNITGHKSLVHDGQDIHLTARAGRGMRYAVLGADVAVGEPYAYLIPAGADVDDRCHAVREFEASYEVSRAVPAAPQRPSRLSLMHMRMLQALDGARAGASQRDIAVAIVGEAVVTAQWSRDGELRAQIRHYLRRGAALCAGGYRKLLDADSS